MTKSITEEAFIPGDPGRLLTVWEKIGLVLVEIRDLLAARADVPLVAPSGPVGGGENGARPIGKLRTGEMIAAARREERIKVLRECAARMNYRAADLSGLDCGLGFPHEAALFETEADRLEREGWK